jgi:PIN domain nuclease of toxin-antitoxin system
VLAEALAIAEKNKVEYGFLELYRLIQNEPEFQIIGFGPEIFEESIRIINIKEIHDRIIIATAKFYGAGIITKDRIIKDSGEVETL